MKKRWRWIIVGFVLMLVSGYGIRRILPRLEEMLYPAAGGVIALVSDRSGDADIYLLDVATGKLTNITNTLDEDESDPAWSPDGTQLAFSSHQRNTRDRNLYIMNADGTVRQALTSNVTPAWSPDGKRIFVSGYYIEGIGHIKGANFSQGWLGSVDTTGGDYQAVTQKELRGLDDADSNPSISPDGKSILYQHSAAISITHVFRADADGSNRFQLDTNLVDDYTGSTKDPAWSPDGTQIALFAAPEIYPSSGRNLGIYVGDRDGNNWRLVAPGFCGNPSWSPDGLYIAHDATYFWQNGKWAVILVTADGKRARHISPSDGYNYYAPAWRPS